MLSFFFLFLIKKKKNILAAPQGIWDLSFLTSDQTHAPALGAWILNHYTARKVPFPSFNLSFIERPCNKFRNCLGKRKELSLLLQNTFQSLVRGMHTLHICHYSLCTSVHPASFTLKKTMHLFPGSYTSSEILLLFWPCRVACNSSAKG